jgi:uncharacterized membrane protein
MFRNYTKENLYTLVKAIVYRIYSSGIIFCISYLITGNAHISLTISIIEVIIKIGTYYLFEKLWDKHGKSRKKDNIF